VSVEEGFPIRCAIKLSFCKVCSCQRKPLRNTIDFKTMYKLARTIIRKADRRGALYSPSYIKRLLSTTTTKAPEAVTILKVKNDKPSEATDQKIKKEACGTTTADDELEELEEMFIMGPAGIEWNGPTRGGARPEPTRYKDWERKGRCTDF
jgi:hypothetical protein